MEEQIPVINGLTEEQPNNPQNKKQEYYIKYLNGLIELKDIPIEMYSSKLLELSAKRNTKEFIDIIFKLVKAKIINVNIAGYAKLFPAEYQTQEVYDMIFSIRPERYYKIIPKKFKTPKMAEELIKLNPQNISIILAEHRTEEFYHMAFEYADKDWFIRVIPDKFKTKEICEAVFKENPENFKYIPDEFKTPEMCLTAVKHNCQLLELVPRNLLNKEICEAAIYYGDGWKSEIFKTIPDEYKTQKMCEVVLSESMTIFPHIPNQYKTPEICLKAVKCMPEFFKLVPSIFLNKEICEAAFYNMNGSKLEIFQLIPEEYKTQKMCEIVFAENTESFKYIPNEYKTEEMCITALRKNFIEYVAYVPKKKINQTIIKITLIELEHLISIKKTIELKGELLEEIIRLYPNLLKSFDRKSMQKIILRELYLIKEQMNSIDMIQTKYGVSKEYIESVLERLKNNDIESYEKIQTIIETQKKEQHDSILKDISNLEKIIDLLGEIKDNNLTTEQRIKFSYLTGKYLVNSIEDIYSFDSNLQTGKLSQRVKNFLEKVLNIQIVTKNKFNLISDKRLMKEIVIANNSWLENYDKDKFFGIKDGVPTIENRYGKNRELLGLNQEQVIIELLKSEKIPLKNIIVKNAFKEFFNDNLFEYIYKLKEYSREFEEKVQKERKQ